MVFSVDTYAGFLSMYVHPADCGATGALIDYMWCGVYTCMHVKLSPRSEEELENYMYM